MSCTIDASVFVATVRTDEPHYAESLLFLQNVQRAALPVICPVLVIIEAAAAVARSTGDDDLARHTLRLITTFPHGQFVPMTLAQAFESANVAVRHRLRGADAVYAAVAAANGSTLVTWDREMLQRGSGHVTVLTPTEWNVRFASF